jgi:sugar transferase (PEP-CTERM/EpsH1 system associated)
MVTDHAGIAPTTVGHTIYAFKEGGMERGLVNIINHGDQGRFRHIILCFTEAGEFARHIQSPSCRVIEFHKGPGNDVRLVGRLAAAIKENGINLLHARGWATLLETAFAARLAGVRASIYGFHGKTVNELGRTSLLRRAAQAIGVRSYNRLVTLNRRMREDFARETFIPRERISIIANGVDHELFSPKLDREALRRRFGIPVDRYIIGTIGRLDPVKNHEVILEALALFPRVEGRPFLLIVGEGEARAMLEKTIKQLGLEDDVCLHGYSNDTPWLLGCMDVYVQSSWYEGFSNTVLEAMSTGLPVLVTDVGGTRDLVDEGREGFFFSPTDASGLARLIRRLWSDRLLLGQMGKQARSRVCKDFTLRPMVEAYESMYRELSCSPSPR